MGFALTLNTEGAQGAPDPENLLVMELEHGTVVIEMLPDLAPKHVARIRELTREGFYDGIVFHRVMDGFMAQTGDPEGTGRGGSGQKIPAEFSSEPFVRGIVGMARSQDPNSGDSQFFICFDDARFLDNNQYTVWGRVIEGMEAVDQIKKAPAGSQSGSVDNPDKMLRVRVKADIN
jgi:peptidylprolyl isomerase